MKKRGYILCCLLLLGFSSMVNAATISIPWLSSSLSYGVKAEAGVDHYQFANRIPFGATTAIDYTLGTTSGDTSSGATLPMPSSGHTTAPQVLLNSPGYHYNSAKTSSGRISGDPASTIRMEVGGDAYASQRNVYTAHYNKWEGARALAEATFEGDFTSTGTVLDYAFDGQLDRFVTANPSVGLVPRSGIYEVIAEHFLTAHLTVENMSTSGTLFDDDIFSIHHVGKGNPSFDISVIDELFSDNGSVDLTGTTGDTIRSSLTLSTFSIAQVEAQLFYTSPYSGLATAGANFDYFDMDFTTTPVPIPAAIWLLGSSLVGLAGIRRKFKK